MIAARCRSIWSSSSVSTRSFRVCPSLTVDLGGGGEFGGGAHEWLQVFEGARHEVALRHELFPDGQLVGVTSHQLAKALRFFVGRDGGQKPVDERVVGLERECVGGLPLAGVHLPLIDEQLRIEVS